MNISKGSQFRREFKKLEKKYRTLASDLELLEKLIQKFPFGDDSRHCNELKKKGAQCICKRRMMCRAVKGSEFRVIYYYDGIQIELIYVEIYYKGNKGREDQERIDKIWKEKTG